MRLNELRKNETAVIKTVSGDGALRRHLLDMGVIPTAEITMIKHAPMGDPTEYKIHGYELTLRLDDAKRIEIEKKPKSKTPPSRKKLTVPEHPCIGESRGQRTAKSEKPLPESAPLSFALAGNQNCGKTTLFNRLTGANQHVGNFPGVTVEKKSGIIKGHPNTVVVDLPGIYSLSPYTSEEAVSRQYILSEKPTAIINIADATSIERSLYLTLQLAELEIPMVLALNMMDEVRGNGGAIRINEAQTMLGIPVVPISASKNEGVEELIEHAVNAARYREKPRICDLQDGNDAVQECISSVMILIKNRAKTANIPIRFAATKLIEGDEEVTKALKLSENEKQIIEAIIVKTEQECGLDRAAAIADMRFSIIGKITEQCVMKPKKSKESIRSKKIDKILTGKYTALPCFAAIMALIFWLTFGVIGARLQQLLEYLITLTTDGIDTILTRLNVNAVLHSLITDGVLGGVGSVLSFLPVIVTLFLFLSLLEDTGYMARVAFIMDKPLRKIGLSGRSIVPMLIGFGCSVPAIMASRTLPSERDRKMTVMLIPFMSCTAKLPVYSCFTSIFFPEKKVTVILLLYLGGIAAGLIVASVAKRTAFRGEAVPFVMELPNYRMPSMKTTLQLLWEKAKDFLQRAFTVIFMASIVIWFLKTFSLRLEPVSSSNESILALIAGLISPIFAPLGFGDWRISTSLITGFIAKESVISTLSVLFTDNAQLTGIMSAKGAASFLTFCLLYTPCVAAINSVKRELGRKQVFKVILLQCSIAWLAAGGVYLIGGFV